MRRMFERSGDEFVKVFSWPFETDKLIGFRSDERRGMRSDIAAKLGTRHVVCNRGKLEKSLGNASLGHLT
jgi:hypothetical protein